MKKAIFFSMFFSIGAVLLAGTLSQSKNQQKWFNYYKNYKKQKNVPKPETMKLNTDSEPDLSAGFTSLYNGQDLKGWTVKGGRCEFVAKGDVIIGTCVPGSPSTYLSTEKSDYSDFIFTCEIKWEVDGNTGVMFRAQSRKGPKNEVVFGPQAEMEGLKKGRGWSGGIYGQSCGGWYYPLWLEEHKEVRAALVQGWNRLTIKAKGKVVKTWVNGQPAAHWENAEHLQGFFSLQVHSGRSGTTHFRNIKVKELE